MNLNLSDEQIQKLKTLAITTLVAFIVSAFTIITGYKLVIEPMFVQFGIVSPTPAIGHLGAAFNVSALPLRCKQAGINCVEIWNGSDISMYSDGGSTRKVFIDGATGNATLAGSLTVSSLISQTTGYELGNGLVGTPSLSFASDTDTGLYRVGANNIAVTAGGTKVFDCTAAGCANTGTFSASGVSTFAVGAAGTPSLTFTGDSNTGIYRVGADDLGIAAGGSLVLDASGSAVTAAVPVAHAAGTAAAPAVTFTGDTDTGIYRVQANNIGITTNGTLALDVSATAINTSLPIAAQAGTVLLPSITFTGDPDTGLYSIGANNIGLSTAGAKVFDCTAAGCTTQGTIKGAAEGNVVINTRHEVTAAEINTGHTLVTVPAGRQFRLVSAEATATGGTCTTSTSVDLLAGANHLAVFTTSNLVQSTLLKAGVSTGAAMLADGASFSAQTAATNLTVAKVGDATAGCASVVFVISYVLE